MIGSSLSLLNGTDRKKKSNIIFKFLLLHRLHSTEYETVTYIVMSSEAS